MRTLSTSLLALLAGVLVAAESSLPTWPKHGTLFLLTDRTGVDLPATESVADFPLLVRLQRDWFPFAETKPHGEDLRFTDDQGKILPHQIDAWDSVAGTAAIWVRIPKISGQQRQPLHLHWGKADAPDISNGAAVFNQDNHYLTVWHLGENTVDATGHLSAKDTGTTPTVGMIGAARHFPGKAGLFAGDKITGLPTGSQPHSTEAWFRPEQANGNVVAWGNEQGQGKVVMQYTSPSHVRMDCYFSEASVQSAPFPAGEWVHVVHTYAPGDTKIYINGELTSATKGRASPLNIRTPARFWIGGWYHNYNFVGDIDEVRLSRVARSATWIKLSYANQGPRQSLHGLLTSPGKGETTLTPAVAEIAEGGRLPFTLVAPGAQKITWLVVRDGREHVVATDRLRFELAAGRTLGDATVKVIARVITANGTVDCIATATIRDTIPEPRIHLQTQKSWDGRSPLDIAVIAENQAALTKAGAGALTVRWQADSFAVTQEARGTTLHLTRAQRSGLLTVKATVDNGGTPTTASATIEVREPTKEAWTTRMADPDEKPADHQFYARDDRGEGSLHCNGQVDRPGAKLTLTVTVDGKPYAQTTPTLVGNRYTSEVRLKSGLVHYRAVLSSERDGQKAILHTADDLVCGDAFIIIGQSNAVSTDWGKGEGTYQSEWVRTYGTMSGGPKGLRLWGSAVHRNHQGGALQIGYWGMELGQRIIEQQKVPVCFINGAVGGTRIDQHQRNSADPTDMTTIYGRLLWRVREARLTHGIRGIFWHQGENDQGADGPTGGYGYELYREFFHRMAGDWKSDYPNVQVYHLFQIWPKSCSMGVNGSDNFLREVQRRLPEDFARMTIQSTLGIDPPGGCHFPPAGYAEMARQLYPVVAREHYGLQPAGPVTAPNLRSLQSNATQDTLTLTFDQPIAWDDTLSGQFSVDGVTGVVTSGKVAGNVLTLRLKVPGGRTLTYLDSKSWSQKTLLRGTNGLAALTFCAVPIAP